MFRPGPMLSLNASRIGLLQCCSLNSVWILECTSKPKWLERGLSLLLLPSHSSPWILYHMCDICVYTDIYIYIYIYLFIYMYTHTLEVRGESCANLSMYFTWTPKLRKTMAHNIYTLPSRPVFYSGALFLLRCPPCLLPEEA